MYTHTTYTYDALKRLIEMSESDSLVEPLYPIIDNRASLSLVYSSKQNNRLRVQPRYGLTVHITNGCRCAISVHLHPSVFSCDDLGHLTSGPDG